MTQLQAQTTLVVTTISTPTPALQALASGAERSGARLIVIGDEKTPTAFSLDRCDYFDLKRQRNTGFRLGTCLPVNNYARKNMGYIAAIQGGADIILETDDDNFPDPGFFSPRSRCVDSPEIAHCGWTNVYRYFYSGILWPRGLPLDQIHQIPTAIPVSSKRVDSPIQQGLVDGDPDRDAIHRLIFPQQVQFRRNFRVALGTNAWCPFNSQSTAWWRDAFALLYLPSYCAFRATDIWRSLVAQRIAWANGWSILFEAPTMTQVRNTHNLLNDFEQEVSMYLGAKVMQECLQSLILSSGYSNIADNMRTCYAALVKADLFPASELTLVDAWLLDIQDSMRD